MKKRILLKALLAVLCFLGGSGGERAFAAPANSVTRVAVSQGISSPAITTPVNFSHGFLYTNPAVAADFVSPYVSVEAATGNGGGDYGAELGLGNGSAGLAAGYIKDDCCNNGSFGAIGGLGTSSVSGGVGYHEKGTYSVGMIVQPKGTHRFGLAADVQSSGGNATSIGAGYSFHANSLIFAIDASRRTAGAGGTLVTPGLELMADRFALSVSYDAYVGDGGHQRENQIWFGLGVGAKTVHFAVYHDYKNKWSGALTFWM